MRYKGNELLLDSVELDQDGDGVGDAHSHGVLLMQ